MINLIKNELYKIFHKKGIYIVLIITLLYSILTNSIYKSDFMTTNLIEQDYEFEEYYMKSMEESGETDSEEYLKSKCYVEVYQYAKSFGEDSWQRVVLLEDENYNAEISFIYENIIKYELGQSKDKEAYELAKTEKKRLTDELNNMTSDEYLNNKLKEVKENLEKVEDTDEELIALYQAELETLELRQTYNIEYHFDDMNDNLSTYQNNRYYELLYQDKNPETLRQEEKELLKEAKSSTALAKTKITNNIAEVEYGSSHYILSNFCSEYSIMLLVIIILIAGSIVSEEFNKGTIKLLLVKPFSRTKILMSKYLTTLIIVFFAIIVTFLIQLIVGGIFFGYSSLEIPVLIYNYAEEVVENINIFKYALLNIAAITPQLVLTATIAFTLSTLLLNTGLANTLTIVGIFGSDIINLLAQTYEIEFLKYFITLNWDFTPFLFGGTSPYKGITLSFSIIICLIYLIAMLALSIISFRKRNIKNI